MGKIKINVYSFLLGMPDIKCLDIIDIKCSTVKIR